MPEATVLVARRPFPFFDKEYKAGDVFDEPGCSDLKLHGLIVGRYLEERPASAPDKPVKGGGAIFRRRRRGR